MPILASPPEVRGLRDIVRLLTIGDIAMSSGAGTLDEFGIRWLLEKVTGWDNSPAPVGQSEQRANGHGLWLSPAYLPGRVIGVEGSFRADWEAGRAAIDRLKEAVPFSGLTPLTVYAGAPALRAEVRQEGEILVDQNASMVRFSVSLQAPDPRRYDAEESIAQTGLPTTSGGLSLPLSLPLSIGATIDSGVLAVVNEGNIATAPVFTIVGPAPAGSIIHRATGRTLTWHDPIAAGRRLIIDTGQQQAWLDGTAPRVVTGTWFDYAPGVNEVAFSAPSYDSSALLVSEHRSAWR